MPKDEIPWIDLKRSAADFDYENAVTGSPREIFRVFGIPCIVTGNVPKNEILVAKGGEIVGRLINIGDRNE